MNVNTISVSSIRILMVSMVLYDFKIEMNPDVHYKTSEINKSEQFLININFKKIL